LLLDLGWSVLVEELVDREVPTTDTHLDLASLHLHIDALGPKGVNTNRLSHEHDLKLLTVGVVVDVLSDFHVEWVVANGNVNGDSCLHLKDVRLQASDLLFIDSDLFQQVKACLIS